MNMETFRESFAGSKPVFLLDGGWHSKVIRLLVGLLMLTMYSWIGASIFTLVASLARGLSDGWNHSAENMIKSVVILLAILELIRTLQSYLEIGRVKVTFILDVALVVLIGELISLWYREYTALEVLLSLGVISLLTLLRIITVKFSPDACDEAAE